MEGHILRIAIKNSRITQEEFASKMGFSRGYLVRLMERAVLPEDIKERACKILKIDMATTFSVQKNTQIGESKLHQIPQPETREEMISLMRETISALKGENDIQKRYIKLLEDRMK